MGINVGADADIGSDIKNFLNYKYGNIYYSTLLFVIPTHRLRIICLSFIFYITLHRIKFVKKIFIKEFVIFLVNKFVSLCFSIKGKIHILLNNILGGSYCDDQKLKFRVRVVHSFFEVNNE